MDQSRFSTAPPKTPDPVEVVNPSVAGRTKRALRSLASRCVSGILYRIARDFVGGEDLDDALKVVSRMANNDLNSTLGFWDTPSYTIKQIADIYFQAIEDCASSGIDIYVSIKPPALHFDKQLARDLSQFAMQKRVRLHCDSHGVDVADDALDFAEVMLKSIDSKLLGITIPCRWQRSARDIEFAIEHQLNVRLVKGQWPDRSGQDRDMKTGFMEAVDRLSGRARHVAVASHDVNLALDAVNQLCESKTSCEFELLYGLPMKELIASAREQKMKPRIYVPFGQGYVPHALKVFRTNPQLALWLGKDRLSRLIG